MRKQASVKKAQAIGQKSLAIAMSVSLALSLVGTVLPQAAAGQVANTCNLSVVSDPTSIVLEVTTSTQNAAATFNGNLAWTAWIPGSTWIWKSVLVENPTQDETYTFRKTFDWRGPVQTALFDLAADNSYRVWLNGTEVSNDPNEVNYTAATQDQVYVTPFVFEGTNTIDMQVRNFGSSTADAQTNPAGALYRLYIHGQGCRGGELDRPTCSDNWDNDGDGLTDFPADTDCSGPNGNEELRPIECSDGIDNDSDGLIDYPNDPGCADAQDLDETNVTTPTSTPTSTPPTPPAPAPSNGGGDGGGSGPAGPTITIYAPVTTDTGSTSDNTGGSNTVGTTNPPASQGEVLGAATTTDDTTPTVPAACNANGEYVTSYLRIGRMNDPVEVSKLQVFLNEQLNGGLSVSGFFGATTKAAVDAFQLAHRDEILKPWADHGYPDVNSPSGYVYKTTRWFLNKIKCNTNAAAPQLP